MTEPSDVSLISIYQLQAQVSEWQNRKWPGHNLAPIKAAKVGEEAGEVIGATFKYVEGRGSKQDIEDEIGDLMIALAGLASLLDINIEQAYSDRWLNDVMHR